MAKPKVPRKKEYKCYALLEIEGSDEGYLLLHNHDYHGGPRHYIPGGNRHHRDKNPVATILFWIREMTGITIDTAKVKLAYTDYNLHSHPVHLFLVSIPTHIFLNREHVHDDIETIFLPWKRIRQLETFSHFQNLLIEHSGIKKSRK